jgi:diguanylate cyclase (GGDEF)-like protein/PAS domain S-box-containing protein
MHRVAPLHLHRWPPGLRPGRLAVRGTAALASEQALLDALPAQACVLDAAGCVLAVNQAWRDFARRHGARPGSTQVGCSYLAVCQQAVRSDTEGAAEAALFLARLREILAGRSERFELTYPCSAPEGLLWFLARVSRIGHGQPLRVLVAHDDISGLRRVQAALERHQAHMDDLAASMPGALFRFVTASQQAWRFVYMSPGVQGLFELTPAQACADGQRLWQCIVPEDRPAHDASIRAAVAAQTVWEHAYRIRTPSGRLKWVQASAQPRPAEDGRVVWTGVLSDVSARKQAEADLQASEATYRTLFETVPQGVVYQNAQGLITSANPAAQRILGLTLDQLQGRRSIDPHWRALRADGSPFPGEEHPAMQTLRSGQPVRDVVMGIAKPDGELVWIQVNATPLFEAGRLVQVYASFEDITRRVLLERELKHQAGTDELTGAANRRSLLAQLAVAFARVRRHPALHCAVLALDLDHFKQVNDAWGHAAGDAVLRHVTTLMRQTVRQLDVVGRSGGEEFLLLLPDTTGLEAMALAERLRATLAASPVAWEGAPEGLAVTASLGVSVITPSDPDVDAVLARADQALYEAKRAGRNTVRYTAGPG